MKKTDYFKLSNVSREVWDVIHALGFFGQTDILRKFFILLSEHFICPKCQSHIKEFILNNKVPSIFDETVFFHNVVNKRIGKPIFDQEKVRLLKERYRVKLLFSENNSFFNFKNEMTGYFYVFLLTYYYDREIFACINAIFGGIINFSSSFEELFYYICDAFPLDEKIFNKGNYKNILKEISNEDFKPYLLRCILVSS